MYCLTNICYVCLDEKDKSLIDINSTLSVNEDIIHIISELPFNLGWMKSNRIILICEECCRRLRETYQLLTMCLKNSAVLQGYMAKINTANISTADNEAVLHVDLNNKANDIHWIKCEIKEEKEFESEPIIDETENMFVNDDVSLVKEEDTWKREEVDDEEESPLDDHFNAGSDNIMKTEIAVNSNTYDTGTAADSSGSTFTQVHTTNTEKERSQIHTAGKPYICAVCGKCLSKKINLERHMRIHTGEKPYNCPTCEKAFTQRSGLVRHMRTHTGEKPYNCSRCKKCFSERSKLVWHMRTHTCESSNNDTNVEISVNNNTHGSEFTSTQGHTTNKKKVYLRVHTAEKQHICAVCGKCFSKKVSLMRHMRIHTGEKPYTCSTCEKAFTQHSGLVRHIRIHTGEKPYQCSRCKKCFSERSKLVCHMRTHTGEKPVE